MSVYFWETGKTRPKKEKLAKLVAVRRMGRREASKQLEALDISSESKLRRRGTFKQTAEELITSLVKNRKATTSAKINAAWKRNGRKESADNSLSRMVKSKQPKRVKNENERGSKYSTLTMRK